MVSVLRRNCYVTPGRSPGFEVARDGCAECASFPGFTAEWIFGDSSSSTVAGPRRDCTGLPFSALTGTLGLQQLYHACVTIIFVWANEGIRLLFCHVR